MASLAVESINIAGLLERIQTNAWLVPTFQRDFVWSEADVTALAASVVEARPIGMATLWEQPDDSELELEAISIPDTVNGSPTTVALNPDLSKKPNKFFGVLDGRQRCTALAMVFGGLRATSGLRRFSGAWFLDVTQEDITERVRYIPKAEVANKGLSSLSTCVERGLFPLATDPSVGLLKQWMGYLQALTEPQNYPNGNLPQPAELAKRNAYLQSAFTGITETILAVYVVPSDYSLGDICEIFETLNTTGTKVSTVDLLHSWLYAETASEIHPIQLREWIDELGGHVGATGWASRTKRPELIAQAVTASYVTIDSNKPEPRKVGSKSKPASITSIKAGDLLATPTQFWAQVIDNTADFAGYIGGFQRAACGSQFDLADSPYPVTMTGYVALRWYMDHDPRYKRQWSVADLDALYGAFFWRTSLLGRYDQGFLSQITADIKWLKDALFERAQLDANSWATQSDQAMTVHMAMSPPSRADLEDRLLSRRPPGALGKALALLPLTRPDIDLLDPSTSVAFPASAQVDIHHIYPKAWCANNKTGTLASALDPTVAPHEYVNSVANLTPLANKSNLVWKAQVPGQALVNAGITYENAAKRLESHFIDRDAYDALVAATPDPEKFWRARARTIATELIKRCQVAF